MSVVQMSNHRGMEFLGVAWIFPSLQDVLEGERYSSLSPELYQNEHFRAGISLSV